MYAFELCAAISDDFRNSPEMAAHDLNTYIFTFTKIGLLSPQFSVQRPAFLKAVFQCESFDVGLIRVGESPEVRVMVLSRLIHLFRTHINHCAKLTNNLINNPWRISCQPVYVKIRVGKFYYHKGPSI